VHVVDKRRIDPTPLDLLEPQHPLLLSCRHGQLEKKGSHAAADLAARKTMLIEGFTAGEASRCFHHGRGSLTTRGEQPALRPSTKKVEQPYPPPDLARADKLLSSPSPPWPVIRRRSKPIVEQKRREHALLWRLPRKMPSQLTHTIRAEDRRHPPRTTPDLARRYRSPTTNYRRDARDRKCLKIE
jgi:hypothetical protein